MSVAVVSPQASGDKGPIDQLIAGLSEVKTQFNATTKFIYVSDPSAYESTVRSLAATGTSIIVAVFPGLQTPIMDVAASFPKTKFILLNGSPYNPVPPNVVSAGLDLVQSYYLAGMLASAASTSGHLGFIGGGAFPLIFEAYNAFKAGAQFINPAATVTGASANSFQDPAAGHAIAVSMYAKGVDVIQTDAAATDAGVIQAAQEKGRLVETDGNPDVASSAPATIVGTSASYFDKMLVKEVKAALQPGWQGANILLGVTDGALDVVPSNQFLTSGPAAASSGVQSVLAKLAQAKAAIQNKSLTIPVNLSSW